MYPGSQRTPMVEIPKKRPIQWVFMGYNPQESLENTINKYHGYTVMGTPDCPLTWVLTKLHRVYVWNTDSLCVDKMFLLAWNQTKCLKQFYYPRSFYAMCFLSLQECFFRDNSKRNSPRPYSKTSQIDSEFFPSETVSDFWCLQKLAPTSYKWKYHPQ